MCIDLYRLNPKKKQEKCLKKIVCHKSSETLKQNYLMYLQVCIKTGKSLKNFLLFIFVSVSNWILLLQCIIIKEKDSSTYETGQFDDK